MSSIKIGLAAAEAARTAPTIGEADRNSRNASVTLAFAQPGDTLLYLLLPVHHAEFGVSLAEAGLLLAANRLVRIAGYGWVARLYADRGPHTACVLAALGSLLSTLGQSVRAATAPSSFGGRAASALARASQRFIQRPSAEVADPPCRTT